MFWNADLQFFNFILYVSCFYFQGLAAGDNAPGMFLSCDMASSLIKRHPWASMGAGRRGSGAPPFSVGKREESVY